MDELFRWAGEILIFVIVMGLAIAVLWADSRGWLEQLDGIEFNEEDEDVD
jgi:hypothetical protein